MPLCVAVRQSVAEVPSVVGTVEPFRVSTGAIAPKHAVRLPEGLWAASFAIAEVLKFFYNRSGNPEG